MSQRRKSPDEQDLMVERALLSEILLLHHDSHHLTFEELVTRMQGEPPNAIGRDAILHSLKELKRSGVIRTNGAVIEPTYAVVRTAKIL
jgi:hypothetical protein